MTYSCIHCSRTITVLQFCSLLCCFTFPIAFLAGIHVWNSHSWKAWRAWEPVHSPGPRHCEPWGQVFDPSVCTRESTGTSADIGWVCCGELTVGEFHNTQLASCFELNWCVHFTCTKMSVCLMCKLPSCFCVVHLVAVYCKVCSMYINVSQYTCGHTHRVKSLSYFTTQAEAHHGL